MVKESEAEEAFEEWWKSIGMFKRIFLAYPVPFKEGFKAGRKSMEKELEQLRKEDERLKNLEADLYAFIQDTKEIREEFRDRAKRKNDVYSNAMGNGIGLVLNGFKEEFPKLYEEIKKELKGE